MKYVTDREILAKCIGIEPDERITKKKDWHLIEARTMNLETFRLDRSSHESAAEVHAPYATLRCFVESIHETSSQLDRFAWQTFVAVFAEENERPDIYHFDQVSTAVKWLNGIEERFVFWKDQMNKCEFKALDLAMELKNKQTKVKEAGPVNEAA